MPRIGLSQQPELGLPFPVERHIHEKNTLAWCDNNTKLLYVRLKAAVDTYVMHTDNEQFDLL